MLLALSLILFGFFFSDIAYHFLWPVMVPLSHINAGVAQPIVFITTATVSFAFLFFGLLLFVQVTFRDAWGEFSASATYQQFARHTRRSWLRWLVRRRQAKRSALASPKWEQ